MRISYSVFTLFSCLLVMACSGEGSSDSPAALAPPAPPAPPPPPPSAPAPTAFDVSQSAWLVFTEGDDIAASAAPSASLECDDTAIPVTTTVLGDGRVVINPEQLLPASAACTVFAGGSPIETFEVSPSLSGEQVVYDRDDLRLLGPLPDDVYTTFDPATPTGLRLAIAVPTDIPFPEQDILAGSIEEANFADGWSPTGITSVSLSGEIDPDTLPSSPEESLDPLSTIAWFDITPGAPTEGERIPFKVEQRVLENPAAPGDGERLSLIPSGRLQPGGVYALVVSNRILDAEGAPLLPSEAFQASLSAEGLAGLTSNATAVRDVALSTLDAINRNAAIPYDTNDVALVLRMSIRSGEVLTADFEQMAELSRERPLPEFTLTSIEESVVLGIGGFVRGKIDVTSYLNPLNTNLLNRDSQGNIVAAGSKSLDVVIALPRNPPPGELPPVIAFLSGSPGSAEDLLLLGNAQGVDGVRPLQAGYAIASVSIDDLADAPVILEDVPPINGPAGVVGGRAALGLQNAYEVLEFLRWLKAQDSFDFFPAGGDGVADFDPSWIGYFGVSAGANRGMVALPYTTDVDAAVLSVGGRRTTERLNFSGFSLSDQTLEGFVGRGSRLTPNTVAALAPLSEISVDAETPLNHVPRHFQDPIDLGTTQRASVLIIEGIVDTIAPNGGTRATAAAYGDGIVRHVPLIQDPVIVLEEGPVNLTGNVNATTTAGFAQFVAAESPIGTPTLGCVQLMQTEGHFCAQNAREVITQALTFFDTSRTQQAPVIAITE